MFRILVVYGTKDGHTAQLAHKMADVLRRRGHQVDVRDARAIPSALSPRVFDGVLIGSSIRWGRHQPAVVAFCREHHQALQRLPCWLFSVSHSAAAGKKGLAEAARYVERFVRDTGWRPERAQLFGGALLYRSSYGVLLRPLVAFAARRAGLPRDTSSDHDLTDWARVRTFALEFDRRLVPREDASERSELQPLSREALGWIPGFAADEMQPAAAAVPPDGGEERGAPHELSGQGPPGVRLDEAQEDPDSEETEMHVPVRGNDLLH